MVGVPALYPRNPAACVARGGSRMGWRGHMPRGDAAHAHRGWPPSEQVAGLRAHLVGRFLHQTRHDRAKVSMAACTERRPRACTRVATGQRRWRRRHELHKVNVRLPHHTAQCARRHHAAHSCRPRAPHSNRRCRANGRNLCLKGARRTRCGGWHARGSSAVSGRLACACDCVHSGSIFLRKFLEENAYGFFLSMSIVKAKRPGCESKHAPRRLVTRWPAGKLFV